MNLQLSLLGSFRATLGDTPLRTFPSEKTRALLAYLAVEHQRSHPRQTLATLLWPDTTDVSARNSLRVTIHRLRTTIDGYVPKLSKDLFRVDRRTIRMMLNDSIEVDVLTFQRYITAVTKHAHTELVRCSTCLKHLTQAIELYQGEFLAGLPAGLADPYDEWVLMTQEALHQQAIWVLDKLLAIYIHKNDYERIITYARRQLVLVPWKESAHRHLMSALVQSKQRAAALAQFETCRQILAEELGVEPDKTTCELYERIKHSTLDLNEPIRKIEPSGNLPKLATNFFGRKPELTQLEALLLDKGSRFVTLVGAGGVGKTRLALTIARQVQLYFPDGVWFVSLEDIQPDTPATLLNQIATLIAETLGLHLSSNYPPLQQIISFLRQHELLLLLDNCEHILDGVDLIISLLAECPQLTILCTSREPLGFQTEYLFVVKGLPMAAQYLEPEATQKLASTQASTNAAISLFADRASYVARGFALTAEKTQPIAQICNLVAGNPLAIELAAALLTERTPTEVWQSIQTSFDVLTTRRRDIPHRHRSMRVVMEQSWQLLTTAEQRLLAQCACFRGGCTQEALLAITNGSLVEVDGLIARSLLQRTEARRYHLHPLLHQFAQEKLTTILSDQMQTALKQTHSRYYLGFAANLAADIVGPRPHLSVAIIQSELDNVRRAWQVAVEESEIELLHQAATTLGEFYLLVSHHEEALATFTDTLTLLSKKTKETALAQRLQSWLQYQRSRIFFGYIRFEEAAAAAQEALELGQSGRGLLEVGYAHLAWGNALHWLIKHDEAQQQYNQALAIATTVANHRLQALTIYHSAQIDDFRGKLEATARKYQQARKLFHQLQDKRQEAYTLRGIAIASYHQGDYRQERYGYEQALAIFQECGDRLGEGIILGNIGMWFAERGRFDEAEPYFQQALQIFQATYQVHHLRSMLVELGWLAHYTSDYTQAEAYFQQVLQLSQTVNDSEGEIDALEGIAKLATTLGHYQQALSFGNRVLKLRQGQDHWLNIVWAKGQLARIYNNRGNYQQAQQFVQATQKLVEETDHVSELGQIFHEGGWAAYGLGDLPQAYTYFQQARDVHEQVGRSNLAIEDMVGLLMVALADGQNSPDKTDFEVILTYVAENPTLDGIERPIWIYLTCYHTLTLMNDSRSETILHHAYEQLWAWANQIDDVSDRRSFLQNVPWHRTLLTLYKERKLEKTSMLASENR